MRNATRTLFSGYLARQAELNGIADASVKFSAAPSVQQTLETRIQESSDFLTRINVIGVQDKAGEKIGLGVSGPASGRTNTSGGAERSTRDLTTLNTDGYDCQKTNFDTHIPYALLDSWAKFPDFQVRITNARIRRQQLDRIMIGFNGTSIAATTDLDANPLLQDVNKGWLQKCREQAPAHVMKEVVAASGKIEVGPGGDYGNLDALVFDMIQLLDPWYQEDPRLVAIVGSGLLHDKYFPIVNTSDKATEKVAADVIMSTKRLGGRPAFSVPYFPPGKVLLTAFENLSLYWQEGARRNHIQDAPKRDRIEFYESSNDDYVVEDYGFVALAENIEIVTGA
jgi:P2 family phage major capsid protein